MNISVLKRANEDWKFERFPARNRGQLSGESSCSVRAIIRECTAFRVSRWVFEIWRLVLAEAEAIREYLRRQGCHHPAAVS